MTEELRRIGFDLHFIARRRRAGCDYSAPFVFHHTHTARTVDGKLRIIAEGWQVDSRLPDHRENILFLVKLYNLTIYNHVLFICHHTKFLSFAGN